MGTLSGSMWDLTLWPGIELWPSALGVQSLSHWTTREVPPCWSLWSLSHWVDVYTSEQSNSLFVVQQWTALLTFCEEWSLQQVRNNWKHFTALLFWLSGPSHNDPSEHPRKPRQDAPSGPHSWEAVWQIERAPALKLHGLKAESRLHTFTKVWPWTSYLWILNLNSLFRKAGEIRTTSRTSQCRM